MVVDDYYLLITEFSDGQMIAFILQCGNNNNRKRKHVISLDLIVGQSTSPFTFVHVHHIVQCDSFYRLQKYLILGQGQQNIEFSFYYAIRPTHK